MSTMCIQGHENPDGAAFCNACGSQIPAVYTPPAPMPVSTPSPLTGSIPSEPYTYGISGTAVLSPTSHAVAKSPKKRNKLILGAVAALLVVAGGGAAVMLLAGGSGSGKHHLQGTLELLSTGDTTGSWDSCSGTGGYDDIQAGASLTVKDGKGNIVGSGNVVNLSQTNLRGWMQADTQYSLGWSKDYTADQLDKKVSDAQATLSKLADLGGGCTLYFDAQVDDADYYQITVSHRQGLNYSKADLEKAGWWVSLSLGS